MFGVALGSINAALDSYKEVEIMVDARRGGEVGAGAVSCWIALASALCPPFVSRCARQRACAGMTAWASVLGGRNVARKGAVKWISRGWIGGVA